MDTRLEKVDNGRRVVVNLKRKYADHESISFNGTPKVTLPLEISSVLPKSKMLKRGRLDSSEGCAIPSGRQLIKYYSNFKRTGVLERLLYYQNDEWNDFSSDVVACVNKDLVLSKNPAVEVQVNGSRILLDFMYMMQLNLDTGLHRSIAWIDVSGNCFFPERIVSYSDSHEYEPNHVRDCDQVGVEPQGYKDVNLKLEIEVHAFENEGSGDSDTIGESFRSHDNEIHGNGCHSPPVQDDRKYGLNVKSEENMNAQVSIINRSLDYDMVRRLFFNAVKPDTAEIVAIAECISTALEMQLEMFKTQLEITKRHRGYGNVQYAWFPCPKGTVSATFNFGIGRYNQQKDNTFGGAGLSLIPANGTHFSVNDIDVDENGSCHVVLCRVILGNMEVVRHGSEQFHPSSDKFDTGVDNLQRPSCYMLWSMDMNRRVYPECIVSFQVTSKTEGLETGTGLRVGASTPISGNNRLPANVCTPRSPWMPFPMLFASISRMVPPQQMELVSLYYELFKNKAIARDFFIQKLRGIVGDAVLKSAITGLRREISEPATSVVDSVDTS